MCILLIISMDNMLQLIMHNSISLERRESLVSLISRGLISVTSIDSSLFSINTFNLYYWWLSVGRKKGSRIV